MVSYVPQNPGTSLNPALRVNGLLGDMLRVHAPERRREPTILSALRRVELPPQREFSRRFPHQLSGGQQQRVAIASALICGPAAVVMDEPTTGLDVVTQARILEEVDRLRLESGLGVVYVTHDLAVVANIADQIAVMYAGRIVESGSAGEILNRPRHPYTHGLMSSIPDHVIPRRLRGIPGMAVGVRERPSGCAFAPRCPQRIHRCDLEPPAITAIAAHHSVRCFEWRATGVLEAPAPRLDRAERPQRPPLIRVEQLYAAHGTRHQAVAAASDVSFDLGAGDCLALVGESGSGKTTIARCIVGLHQPSGGRILLDDVPLAAKARTRTVEARRRIQLIFQNPADSLNPRQRIGDEIARPARVLRGFSRVRARDEATSLLERVRLPAQFARRFPSELSGGELQRVAIARALAADPDVLICDEITSALDVSVQAAVLDLLVDLRQELGLAILFISHDLGVVASIADRILVLERGETREQGWTREVLSHPTEIYTRLLLEAAPRIPTADERR
jgi:peptide/nickel transport system ATP-binding protein